MPNRLMSSIIAFVGVLFLSTVVFAQSSPQAGAEKEKAASNKPHDLSGFWDMTTGGPGALNETSNNRPPMTDWAKAIFSKTKTGYKDLSTGANPDPKDWNDPTQWCDPPGFPRILWNPMIPGMRLAQMPEEVIQFFENGRAWRDLWTDGRKLPAAGGDAEARWFGYAIGKWDGDTLVVNSDNYLDRSWLDQYGSPHSDQLTVQERYLRPDRDHLVMYVDITDPKAYTATWKGDKKTLVLVDKPSRSDFNDFDENICVWSEVKVRPRT